VLMVVMRAVDLVAMSAEL